MVVSVQLSVAYSANQCAVLPGRTIEYPFRFETNGVPADAAATVEHTNADVIARTHHPRNATMRSRISPSFPSGGSTGQRALNDPPPRLRFPNVSIAVATITTGLCQCSGVSPDAVEESEGTSDSVEGAPVGGAGKVCGRGDDQQVAAVSVDSGEDEHPIVVGTGPAENAGGRPGDRR